MLSHIWVKPESDLDQLSTRSLTSFNQYAVNSLAFTVNWLEFDLWHIHNRDQQNMTLKLNEQWIDLQVNHIKRLNELKINQTTIDT